MYDPWNFGGLNPSFFVIWGGLAPPSPYVEPPLVRACSSRGGAEVYHNQSINQSISQSSLRLLITPLTGTQRGLQDLECKHKNMLKNY